MLTGVGLCRHRSKMVVKAHGITPKLTNACNVKSIGLKLVFM
jgi:hypothetical protein